MVRILQKTAEASLENTVVADISLPSGCTIPSDLQPLVDLANAVTELLFIGGLLLGVAGIMVSGAYFIVGTGPESIRKAKSIFKNVAIGVVLILSAEAIVAFLLSQVGASICA